MLAGEKSRAEIKVKLTKGRWTASLFAIAGTTEDDPEGTFEQDAVYMEFAGQLSRLYDDTAGKEQAKVANEDPNDFNLELHEPTIDIKKNGEYTIVLRYAEPNVTLDSVLLTRQ